MHIYYETNKFNIKTHRIVSWIFKLPHEKSEIIFVLKIGLYNFKNDIFINRENVFSKKSFYNYIFGFRYKIHYHGHNLIVTGFPSRNGFQYNLLKPKINMSQL